VLCFLEVIIFNEEILLALCFFSFFFFCFNSLGSSVFDIFYSRATKFEADLLVSYSLSKQSITKLFDNYLASRGFSSKFKILAILSSNYLSSFLNYSIFKLTSSFYTLCSLKLSELAAFESKLLSVLQKKGVSLLLYPLIFQTAKNNLNLLTGLKSKGTVSLSFPSKVSVLKTLS
jgi:hypothetical protein